MFKQCADVQMFSSARDVAKTLSVIIVQMIKHSIIEVEAVNDVTDESLCSGKRTDILGKPWDLRD